MKFVDTHCHIHFDDYLPDAKQVLRDSAAAGVRHMVTVGCSLADSKKAIDFAAGHEGVWAAAGTHPHGAADFNGQLGAADKLSRLLSRPKVVAVGEIGLDYFRENSPRAAQKKALKAQIEAGISSGLPFVFHIRDAWEDFWPIFDEYGIKKGIVHSFSAGPAELEKVLARNLYVGLNGIMTFTKVDAQLEAAKQVPLHSLMLETDAPFLAPKPFRGKRCEPKHLINTAKFLAELRGESLEEIARETTANAVKLFGLDRI